MATKTKFHYRVDTIIFRDQHRLEDQLNEIASTDVDEGRWRLHTVHIGERDEPRNYTPALLIYEREIKR